LIESRDITQIGLVSKEIVQVGFFLVCSALFELFGLDEVSASAI